MDQGLVFGPAHSHPCYNLISADKIRPHHRTTEQGEELKDMSSTSHMIIY